MILWFACVGADPFRNEAPRLLSFNGEPVDKRSTLVTRLDAPAFGEPYALDLEVEDPERGPVRVWFPYAQGTVAFDPDGTEGVWDVPADPDDFDGAMTIDLEDAHDPPGRRQYTVIWPYLFTEAGDTGAE